MLLGGFEYFRSQFVAERPVLVPKAPIFKSMRWSIRKKKLNSGVLRSASHAVLEAAASQ